MIPRSRPRRLARADEKWAFADGELARPLRLVIDSETIPAGDALDCLRGFAHHPDVEVLATSGDFPNRLRLGGFDREDRMVLFDLQVGEQRIHTGVDAADLLDVADKLAHVPQHEARHALILAAASEESRADGLVTENRVIREVAPRPLVEHANPMSAEGGIALLGLYLRSRGDFTIERDDGYTNSTTPSSFYVVVARELLPSAWRWFSACVQYSAATGDRELALTAQSAFIRVMRALRARDRLHRELQVPVTPDSADESLFYFEAALLMLGGAFDVTARVADAAYGFATSPHAIGWTTGTWRKELRDAGSDLARVMRKGSPSSDARELVAVLRNTIHGEALGSLYERPLRRRSEGRAILPPGVEARLEVIARRRGGLAHFGVEESPRGDAYVDAGVYVEATLPLVTEALNAIMDATPVERLSGVDVAHLTRGPPDHEVFHPAMRCRLRLLAGLA